MSEWQCDTCIYKKDNMAGGPTCPEFSFFWRCITDISDGKEEQTGHCKRIIPGRELE